MTFAAYARRTIPLNQSKTPKKEVDDGLLSQEFCLRILYANKVLCSGGRPVKYKLKFAKENPKYVYWQIISPHPVGDWIYSTIPFDRFIPSEQVTAEMYE